MKRAVYPVLATGILLGLTGCGTDMKATTADLQTVKVAQTDMPAYCIGEAAEAFSQKANDITTLPAEPDGNGYTVRGQYPAIATAENATFFTCRFSATGVPGRIRKI